MLTQSDTNTFENAGTLVAAPHHTYRTQTWVCTEYKHWNTHVLVFEDVDTPVSTLHMLSYVHACTQTQNTIKDAQRHTRKAKDHQPHSIKSSTWKGEGEGCCAIPYRGSSSVTGTWNEPWMLLHLAEPWLSGLSRSLKIHSDSRQMGKTFSQDQDVNPSLATVWKQECGNCRMCTHGPLAWLLSC